MKPKERKAKLATLVRVEGFNDLTELLQACVCDSVSPGVCINPGCNYTTEVEPDCQDGWCEECNTNSVQSAMVLAGVI